MDYYKTWEQLHLYRASADVEELFFWFKIQPDIVATGLNIIGILNTWKEHRRTLVEN